ncbi:MAG: molybdate ABC transporter substrate-binding protein [Actinobacteria bacterium]|nr:molybdate ABC transporter substrate-binding protein [Actinomycetota bacterium]
MRTKRLFLVSSVAILGPLVASCGGAPDGGAKGSGGIVVFAASSLTEAFTEVATAFNGVNPNAKVMFNFAGSGELVTQISQGAPADAFVSADDSNMKKLAAVGEVAGDPVVIAKNTFQIIVENGNPQGITGLLDLANPELVVVLCAETVPCGTGAATILKNSNVTVTPKSLEDKVKGVVAKVTTGEADAGIVFVTDVKAAGDKASGVEIPTDVNVVTNYPMAVTKEAANAALARVFIDFVSASQGQAILAKYGFLAP